MGMNEGEVIEQYQNYIVIIQHFKGTNKAIDSYEFNHFNTADALIVRVGQLSALQDSKVHKILRMDALTGDTCEMDLKYEEGKLFLVEHPKPGNEGCDTPLENYSTKDLHTALCKRTGVSEFFIAPYETLTLDNGKEDSAAFPKISGPARIIINKD